MSLVQCPRIFPAPHMLPLPREMSRNILCAHFSPGTLSRCFNVLSSTRIHKLNTRGGSVSRHAHSASPGRRCTSLACVANRKQPPMTEGEARNEE